MSIKPFGIIRPCTKHQHLSPYNSAGVVGNLRLEGVAGGIPPKVGGGDVRIIVELTKRRVGRKIQMKNDATEKDKMAFKPSQL